MRGHRLAERAVADDAEHAVLQLPDRIREHRELPGFLPSPAGDQRLVVRDAVRQRQQERKHVLCDGGGAVAAQVADGDAGLPGRCEIDVVDAGRGECDQLERRVGADRRAVDDGLVRQHRLEPGDPAGHVGLGRALVDHDAGQRALERAGVEVAVADGAEVEEDRAHAQAGSSSSPSMRAVSSRACSS